MQLETKHDAAAGRSGAVQCEPSLWMTRLSPPHRTSSVAEHSMSQMWAAATRLAEVKSNLKKTRVHQNVSTAEMYLQAAPRSRTSHDFHSDLGLAKCPSASSASGRTLSGNQHKDTSNMIRTTSIGIRTFQSNSSSSSLARGLLYEPPARMTAIQYIVQTHV